VVRRGSNSKRRHYRQRRARDFRWLIHPPIAKYETGEKLRAPFAVRANPSEPPRAKEHRQWRGRRPRQRARPGIRYDVRQFVETEVLPLVEAKCHLKLTRGKRYLTPFPAEETGPLHSRSSPMTGQRSTLNSALYLRDMPSSQIRCEESVEPVAAERNVRTIR